MSLLEKHGVPEVADLVGGIAAWTASNLPIETHPATYANS